MHATQSHRIPLNLVYISINRYCIGCEWRTAWAMSNRRFDSKCAYLFVTSNWIFCKKLHRLTYIWNVLVSKKHVMYPFRFVFVAIHFCRKYSEHYHKICWEMLFMNICCFLLNPPYHSLYRVWFEMCSATRTSFVQVYLEANSIYTPSHNSFIKLQWGC